MRREHYFKYSTGMGTPCFAASVSLAIAGLVLAVALDNILLGVAVGVVLGAALGTASK